MSAGKVGEGSKRKQPARASKSRSKSDVKTGEESEKKKSSRTPKRKSSAGKVDEESKRKQPARASKSKSSAGKVDEGSKRKQPARASKSRSKSDVKTGEESKKTEPAKAPKRKSSARKIFDEEAEEIETRKPNQRKSKSDVKVGEESENKEPSRPPKRKSNAPKRLEAEAEKIETRSPAELKSKSDVKVGEKSESKEPSRPPKRKSSEPAESIVKETKTKDMQLSAESRKSFPVLTAKRTSEKVVKAKQINAQEGEDILKERAMESKKPTATDAVPPKRPKLQERGGTFMVSDKDTPSTKQKTPIKASETQTASKADAINEQNLENDENVQLSGDVGSAPGEASKCKNCKKIENVEQFHNWGRCKNKGCTYRWCNVGKCAYATTDVTQMENHLKQHQEKNDLRKCFNCGGVKSKKNLEQSGKCSQCNIMWCLIGLCRREFDNENALKVHQKAAHNEPKAAGGTDTLVTDSLPDPPSFVSLSKVSSGEAKAFPDAFVFRRCTCAKTSNYIDYFIDQCSNCQIYSCRYKNCTKQYGDLYMMRVHQRTHLKDTDLDRCFTCGEKKDRDAGKAGGAKFVRSPRCRVWWCLVDDCKEEFEDRQEMFVHHFHIAKQLQ